MCAVFPRVARENRTQKIGKHHAAAGKKRGYDMGTRSLSKPLLWQDTTRYGFIDYSSTLDVLNPLAIR